MHLPPCGHNRLPHALDDLGQLIRPDVRVGIDQNRRICTELDQPFQRPSDVPAFVAARVQFAIAVSARTSFAEAVIRIRINAVLARDAHEVTSALTHRLSAFDDDGTEPVLNQGQCRVQPCWACPHNVHGACVFGQGGKVCNRGFVGRQHLILQRDLHPPHGKHGALARIEVLAHDPVIGNSIDPAPHRFGNGLAYPCRIATHLNREPNVHQPGCIGCFASFDFFP